MRGNKPEQGLADTQEGELEGREANIYFIYVCVYERVEKYQGPEGRKEEESLEPQPQEALLSSKGVAWPLAGRS